MPCTRRASWGAGIRTRYPAPKAGVLPLDDPPRSVARAADTTMPRVPAPTVADPRRGRGHAHALRDAEGAAPALRPPDDRCGRSPPPARPAPAGSWSSTARSARLERAPARRASSVAVQEEPRGTGDAVPPAADQIDADAPVIVALRRRAADHRRGDRARSRERTTSSGAAATMATMELDDPTGYGRVVRGAGRRRRARRRDQDAGRRDARGAGDPRGQRRHLRVRRRRPARRARAARAPTTRRASSTCPTCCRSCAPTGKVVARARGRPTRRSRSASTTASTSPRSRALAQRAHPRAPHALAGVTIVDPGEHADRRRRRDRRATRSIEPFDVPARRDAHRRRAARSARSPR